MSYLQTRGRGISELTQHQQEEIVHQAKAFAILLAWKLMTWKKVNDDKSKRYNIMIRKLMMIKVNMIQYNDSKIINEMEWDQSIFIFFNIV